jgi:N-methylhydantoinase B/oxoprolinase/acetone carboxylase alpha subunit
MSAPPIAARYDPATLEILWSRLHGVTEEMWNTILRTSFSTIVGAALDYGCAILDAEGGQLVHATGSMPLFNLALPAFVRDLLQRYGGRIYPGDVFIGNDPWILCGHLPDVAIVTPVFHKDRLVAFSTSVAHQADFGGAHGARRVREVYEEGLFVPVMKLYERGARNETLFEIIGANVRVSDLVLGDLDAQVTANELGAQRLVRLMREYDLDDPSALAAELQGRSEQAMRAIIRDLPDGTYRAEGLTDALDVHNNPTKIAVAITIAGDEILVDYAGTGDQLESGGLNCTLAYTVGDTHYGIKSILAPDIPHNEGSTRPIKVLAPSGSILNCTKPVSVHARTRTGWHVYAPLFAALSGIAPERVMAGPGLLVFPRVVGTYPDGKGYNAPIFAGGGQGASRGRDGIGGYIFPSSASSVSTEVFEAACPAMITEKEWITDSSGAGQFRGGPAERLTLRRLPGHSGPVRIFYIPIRGVVPASGMLGGGEGTLDLPLWNGRLIASDSEIRRDGWTIFRADSDELTFHVASGGGYGDPHKRDRAAIEADIRSGLISREAAARDYGYRPSSTQGAAS